VRRFLLGIVGMAALVAAGAWIWAGRAEGPTIEVGEPARFIGQTTPLDVTVESPGGEFSSVDIVLEQGARSYPIFTLDQPAGAVRQDTAERIYIIRPVGKRDVPELEAGPARIVVRAARPVLYGLRHARRGSTARPPSGGRAVIVSLHQPWRRRVRRLPGHAR
jgi:hypothetical protein